MTNILLMFDSCLERGRRRADSTGSDATGSSDIAGAVAPDVYEEKPDRRALELLLYVKEINTHRPPSSLTRLARMTCLLDSPASFSESEALSRIQSLTPNSTKTEVDTIIQSFRNEKEARDYINGLLFNRAIRNLLFSASVIAFGTFSVWDFGMQNKEVASTNLTLLTNGFALPNKFETFLAVDGNTTNGFFYRATLTEIISQWKRLAQDISHIINHNNWSFFEKFLYGFMRITVELIIFGVAFLSAAGDYVMSRGLEKGSYWLVIIFHFLSGLCGMYGFKKPVDDFLVRDKNKPLLTWKNFRKGMLALFLSAIVFFAFYPSALLAVDSALGSWIVIPTVAIGYGNALLFSYNLVYNGLDLPNPKNEPFAFLLFVLTSIYFLASGNNTYAAATMVLVKNTPLPPIERVVTSLIGNSLATGLLNTMAAQPEISITQQHIITLLAGKKAIERVFRITLTPESNGKGNHDINNPEQPLLPKPRVSSSCTIL